MVHADKTEGLLPPIDHRTEYAGRSAHCTVGDHYRSVSDRVYDLVMITDQLYGIGFGLSVDHYANNQFRFIHITIACSSEGFIDRLIKYFIRRQSEIESVEYDAIRYQDQW